MGGGALGVNELFDAVPHGFRGMRIAAVRGRDGGGEEILQFKGAAICRHVLVRGDARDGRFVHLNGVRDSLQVERPQIRHALREEAVLLAHDFSRNFQDRPCALVQRAHQPGRILQAISEIGLVAILADRLDNCV